MAVYANNYTSKYFLREITETKDLIDPQIFLCMSGSVIFIAIDRPTCANDI